MKFNVSEKRAAFLAHNFFNYSFEGRELDLRIFQSIGEPIELQYIAQNHNYDNGNDLLNLIINHPKCDISTAKMIFFRSDIDGFIEHKNNCGDTDLITSILKNFENNFYSRERFYYNPDQDPDSLHFDRQKFLNQYQSAEALFSKPKGKRIEPSFAQAFHLRNLKFYEGNTTITSKDGKFLLTTPHNEILFQIPVGFVPVNDKRYNDFFTSWKFSENLEKRFDTSDKVLKKVLIKPQLIVENEDFIIVMNIFNSQPLQLIGSVTNVATILRNELVYLEAFVDIVGVEDEFTKFKRIKHDNAWFVSTKVMQIKVVNIESFYFLKLLLVEVEGILFSLFIITSNLDKFIKEITSEIINSFSIKNAQSSF
ncbi:DUF4274 domain-containing protein [Chryseobacterium sp.]|jgi:hypothetical protein|uniref:DUF4274 domain-containing protein n=1 Tax=Chryseobacterium sp. TaxID=1871047 RepID=UPI00283C1C5A|nr:DUF4274 domain-containing protein [Chryseobacterium sp.]MDR3025056.1 DUF4274 domain-containing protein [Chryseobacterium sp.]